MSIFNHQVDLIIFADYLSSFNLIIFDYYVIVCAT